MDSSTISNLHGMKQISGYYMCKGNVRNEMLLKHGNITYLFLGNKTFHTRAKYTPHIQSMLLE